MPIGIRLTLWYGLLLGLTLMTFSGAMYVGLQAALERNLDSVLRARAVLVELALIDKPGDENPDLSPAEIQPEDLEPMAIEGFGESDVYVQVISTQGVPLASSGTQLPVHADSVIRALNEGEAYGTLDIGDGKRLRAFYWPVHDGDKIIGIVQVAETLDMVDQTMRDAQTLILGGIVVALVAALGSGWFLTRRALAPVRAVTSAARHIAKTGRFDRRLAASKPHDELGALAATFDIMIARLEGVVSQQRQLLADTSHELRNPLSIVRGNLDFARRVTADQACLEAVHEAEMEAARMSRLIDDLLLLASADAGEFLSRRLVRLDEVTQNVVERARLHSHGQFIEVDPMAPVWLVGDPDRLVQMFWNLLENALRYTPPGGTIRLALDCDGREAIVEITDSGPGVPAGHEERVFERFHRADVSRARSTGGTGLGLSIVKHIAEAHGGRVWLTNRVRQGATFSVALPVSSSERVLENRSAHVPSSLANQQARYAVQPSAQHALSSKTVKTSCHLDHE